ncbi:MAG: hypothetical protein ACYDCO_28190 [Armatimonadota bacterium]
MKCFYHQDHDAVGTCKSCGKCLCPECAVDLGKGLACKGRCEADAEKVNAVIEHNIAMMSISANIMKNHRKNTYMQAAFLLAAGAVFLVTALLMGVVMEMPGLLGIVFLAYGGYVMWRGVTLPK